MADPELEKPEPKKLGEPIITVYDNDDIGVTGFPRRLEDALACMHSAEVIIIHHFMKAMAEGRYELGGVLKPKKKADDNSMLYCADSSLVLPIGLMNGANRRKQ
jgi:hypothetical protein